MTNYDEAADRNTLRYAMSRMRVNKERPFGAARSCEMAAQTISAFMGSGYTIDKVADPIEDAAEFYLLNHLVARIRMDHSLDEPIPHLIDIVYLYERVAALHAMRLFCYLTLITTRESRHKHNEVVKTFYGVHDPAACAFIDSLPSSSSAAAMKFRKHPPSCSLLKYVAVVRDNFYKGKFSSSFGGKKWGSIADCLLSFVNGEFTAEMMIDHAWALQHNGGAMFNKGMIYSHPSSGELYQVLDVQRAGMMPQFWLNDSDCPHTTAMADAMKIAMNHYGDAIFDHEQHVDWDHVVSLGAMSNMSKSKATGASKKAGAKKASNPVGPKNLTTKKATAAPEAEHVKLGALKGPEKIKRKDEQ